MNRIFNRSKWLYIFAFVFLAALFALFVTMEVNSTKWVIKDYNQHLYSDGELLAAGTITDRNGVVLAQTVDGERIYHDDVKVRKATLHVVGDTAGFIATGVQSAYKSELTGYSRLNGVYNLKKNGSGNDIQLSIDSALSVTAFEALGDFKGTIGVYNYLNGEILCAVSTPTYDIYDKPDDIATDDTGKYEGIYMNRFFSGLYTPGSTFKIITACCAIDNMIDIDKQTFTCNGAWVNSVGNKVTCNGVHGTVNFEQALNRSCNTVFAKLAVELGNDAMTATAEEFGFNKRLNASGIKCAMSTYNVSEAYDIDLAWSGIGQYTTMLNPCHAATILGSIANRTGYTPTPTIIKGERTSNLDYAGSVPSKQLDDMLRSNVENYYKDSSFPNLLMAGKTGTAEVSNKKPHAWFVGYSQRNDLPLCIVVVLENSGGSGIRTAVPIANKVMQKALDLYGNDFS